MASYEDDARRFQGLEGREEHEGREGHEGTKVETVGQNKVLAKPSRRLCTRKVEAVG